MPYQNPAFYFYHGMREALTVGSPTASVLDALHDGRQGEILVFDDDFTTTPSQSVSTERPDTPEADAIDTLIIASHNLTGTVLNVQTGPTVEDLLDPNYSVAEAAGVLIIRPLTNTQAVLPSHENINVFILQGTAAGSTVPEMGELMLTTKREMIRGPDPNWEHPWVRSQTQFTNEAGVTSTWLKGAARKRFRMTWRGLEGADRQLLFDLQAQTNDWSEPFYFQPPDTTYDTLLVELERDADWKQDFLSPLDTGTTDEVTLNLIEVLG